MNNKISAATILEAVSVLKDGGVIAFPTETTYGIGCDPRNAEAVERVFRVKGRDSRKPLLLVAGSWEQVEQVATLSTYVREIANKYWPGPLTVVLPVRLDATLVEGVSVEGEVAVRFSSSELVQMLTQAFCFSIIATSANVSGQPDSRSVDDIRAYQLGVDYIIDGGTLPVSKPSTVIRVKEGGQIQVLREGVIIF